jgi:hypothetical protein
MGWCLAARREAMPTIANVDGPKIAWATVHTTEKKPSKSAKSTSLKDWVYPDPGTNQASTYWAEEIKDRDLHYAEALSKEFAGREAALRDLVLKVMHTDPVIHDGLVWAAQPIAFYAETLSIGTTTADCSAPLATSHPLKQRRRSIKT